MIKNYFKKSGFIFVEILVAIAIITIVFTILLGIGFSAINLSASMKRQTQADFLAKEELEALRSYRDGSTWETSLGAVNFTDINDNNPYYMILDSGDTPKWTIRSGKETAGIFTRYIVFDRVSRDPVTKYIQDTYVPSNNDSETVKVKVTISWLDKVSQVFAYLTNWNGSSPSQPPTPTKAITAFNFNALSPAVIGIINESAKTIALTVPYGTNVTNLVPSITHTGVSVSPASGVAHDFSSPAIYTVTASDGSTQPYTVTVTIAPNSAKAITAFNFNALSPAVIGFIYEITHNIELAVPFGTNVTNLVPSITHTGVSVSPASGVAHDFSSPAIYTVTASDGSTQPYTVTVTVTPEPIEPIVPSIADNISVIKLDSTLDSAHFVVGYQDISDNFIGMARVGTVNFSDGSISYGPEYIFNNPSGTTNIALATLDSTHFVAVYEDGSNLHYGTAIVGTVSGNEISFGSEYVFNINNSDMPISLTTLDSTRFVVGYNDHNSLYCTAMVGTVSGSVISFGSKYVFYQDSSLSISLTTLDSTRFVAGYTDGDGDGAVKVGTVSGNAISFGSERTFNVEGYTTTLNSTVSLTTLDSNHFVAGYNVQDLGGISSGVAVAGTAYDDIIYLGPQYSFNSCAACGVATYDLSLATLNPNHFVAGYIDFGNNYYGTAVIGGVFGNVISHGEEHVFNSGTIGTFYHSVSAVALDSTHFVVGYTDGDNNNYYGTTVLGTLTGYIISYGSEYGF